MKKILALMLAAAFITLMCASVSFGVAAPAPIPAANPDNTMTGNPNMTGGINPGGGNTDMTDIGNTNGINGPLNGTPGTNPGTKLFGTFPQSGD